MHIHVHTDTHSIWFECVQTQEQNVQCDVASVYLVKTHTKKTFYPEFLSAELEASSEPITLSPFLARQQMHTLNALSEPIICSICPVEGIPASIRCSRWPVGVGSWESVPRPKKIRWSEWNKKKKNCVVHTYTPHTWGSGVNPVWKRHKGWWWRCPSAFTLRGWDDFLRRSTGLCLWTHVGPGAMKKIICTEKCQHRRQCLLTSIQSIKQSCPT